MTCAFASLYNGTIIIDSPVFYDFQSRLDAGMQRRQKQTTYAQLWNIIYGKVKYLSATSHPDTPVLF